MPLARILVAIGGVYTAQSLVGGISFIGIPAVLRANGAPLETVGIASLLMLPWALKFLWAPWIEQWRHDTDGHRRSRSITLIGELIAAGGLAALSLFGPDDYAMLFALLGLVALASASVDIAVDAFAIEQLAPSDRGWGNTAQVGGGYLGMVLGGGLFLMLISRLGWTVALVAAAGAVLALSLPFIAGREPRISVDSAPHRPSLAFAWRRLEVRLGLGIALLFEAGVRLAQAMLAPFLIDRGLSLDTVGMINGMGGVAAGLAGTVLGGWLVRRWGTHRAVVGAAGLQTATLALLALSSLLPTILMPAASVLLLNAAMAAGFVSLYALLMGFASLRQAGVDFTLFQCADALVAGLAGYAAGLLAGALGYGACFGLAMLASAIGMIAIRHLLGHHFPTGQSA